MGAVEVNKLDIFNENFEEYFIKKVSEMTQQQANILPSELKNKLFQGGLMRPSYRLKFNEKAYILSTVFDSEMIIMFKDKNVGIGPDQWTASIAAEKGKIKNGELASRMPINNMFIVGNKELMSPIIYLNHIFCSDIYKLFATAAIREKSPQEKRHIKRTTEYKGIVEAFTHYEATKKLIAHEFKLDMPSWYAMLYFGNKERPGRPFYTQEFKYAYSSNKDNLYGALKKLVDNGYMSQRGKRNDLRYSLTAKGLDTLNQIIDRVILNYKKSS